MVQVIEQGNFGGRLGESVGQLLQNHAAMMQQRQQQKMLANLLNPQAQSTAGGSSIPQEMSPEQEALAFAQESQLVNPEFAKMRQQQRVEAKSKMGTEKALKGISQLLGRTQTGPVSGRIGIGKEGRRDRQQIDVLATRLLDEARKREGTGQMTNAKLELLQKVLPSSKKSKAENYGAILAWADELGIDPKSLGVPNDRLPQELQETITVKPVAKGTKITAEIADSYLKKANGDAVKARKLAKQHGYEF